MRRSLPLALLLLLAAGTIQVQPWLAGPRIVEPGAGGSIFRGAIFPERIP
jgi:hypothetical protein